MAGWWSLRWVSWSGYEAEPLWRRFSDRRKITDLKMRQPKPGSFNWLAANPDAWRDFPLDGETESDLRHR